MCVCVCFIAYVIHLRAGIEGLLHSFHYASTQLIDQERMRPALVFIQCFDAVGWNLDGRKGVQPVKTSAIYPQLLSPVWARGRCRISPPRFLAECCKRQLNQVSLVLLYFSLSAFSDLCWVCLSVFSCTVFFVSISQVIGCEDRLRNDLYCVGWGVKLYSNQNQTKPSCCHLEQMEEECRGNRGIYWENHQ